LQSHDERVAKVVHQLASSGIPAERALRMRLVPRKLPADIKNTKSPQDAALT
jgi:hypothetical protein